METDLKPYITAAQQMSEVVGRNLLEGIDEFDGHLIMVAKDIFRKPQFHDVYIPDPLALRILRDCLRDSLTRCPAVFFQQHGTLIHIVDQADRNQTVYIGASLADAADAVIARVEGRG
jgi:hypothetical protein